MFIVLLSKDARPSINIKCIERDQTIGICFIKFVIYDAYKIRSLIHSSILTYKRYYVDVYFVMFMK